MVVSKINPLVVEECINDISHVIIKITMMLGGDEIIRKDTVEKLHNGPAISVL